MSSNGSSGYRGQFELEQPPFDETAIIRAQNSADSVVPRRTTSLRSLGVGFAGGVLVAGIAFACWNSMADDDMDDDRALEEVDGSEGQVQSPSDSTIFTEQEDEEELPLTFLIDDSLEYPYNVGASMPVPVFGDSAPDSYLVQQAQALGRDVYTEEFTGFRFDASLECTIGNPVYPSFGEGIYQTVFEGSFGVDLEDRPSYYREDDQEMLDRLVKVNIERGMITSLQDNIRTNTPLLPFEECAETLYWTDENGVVVQIRQYPIMNSKGPLLVWNKDDTTGEMIASKEAIDDCLPGFDGFNCRQFVERRTEQS